MPLLLPLLEWEPKPLLLQEPWVRSASMEQPLRCLGARRCEEQAGRTHLDSALGKVSKGK